MTVGVLVVDDNPIVRSALRGILMAADGVRVLGEASNGREALHAARRLRPDVTLLDHRMPIADGLSVLDAIVAHTAVLVLTSDDDPRLITGMLHQGARGYLVHGEFDRRRVGGRLDGPRPGVAGARPARGPPRLRPHRARGGRARARVPGPHERVDRASPAADGEDGEEPPEPRVRQAARPQPDRGRRALERIAITADATTDQTASRHSSVCQAPLRSSTGVTADPDSRALSVRSR
jgi:CheY-like chemotaxis protein